MVAQQHDCRLQVSNPSNTSANAVAAYIGLPLMFLTVATDLQVRAPRIAAIRTRPVVLLGSSTTARPQLEFSHIPARTGPTKKTSQGVMGFGGRR